MGKRRNRMMKQIDAFEEEIRAYAQEHTSASGVKVSKFEMSEQAKLALIERANKAGEPLEVQLESLRMLMRASIDDPLSVFAKPALPGSVH